MVTASDISFDFTGLSKPGGKYLVGDTVSGNLRLKLPGKLAIWRIELRMGNQRITLATDQELEAGTHFFPFVFPQPIRTIDFKGPQFNIHHNLQADLHPSRIKNELKGDPYLKKFGGVKTTHHPSSVLRGDARYRIRPRQLLLNGKDRSWWLILMAILFGSSLFIPEGIQTSIAILLISLPFLYWLEGDYVGRYLFGHLLAEIRTDHKGIPHLHLEPRGAGEEFLDARIGFRIKQVTHIGDESSSSEIFRRSVKIRDKAIRLGKRFLVPLPFPPGTVPATYKYQGQAIEWEFFLEYKRPWGKNTTFTIPIDVDLAPLEQAVKPEDLGLEEEEVLDLELLRERETIRLRDET